METTEHYCGGQLHRMDGPVVENDEHGSNWWYSHNKLHRLDGPAVTIIGYHRAWRVDGIRHRTDGPAIEYDNGGYEWFHHGQLHRDFGLPACWVNGLTFKHHWYVYGKNVTKKVSFDLAIESRKNKFGLFLVLLNCLEDDLFTLLKLNWN